MQKSKFKFLIIPTLLLSCFLLLLFFTSLDVKASSTEEVSYVIPYNMYTFISNNTYCYDNNDAIIQAGINWNSDIAGYDWDNYIAFPIEEYWGSYGEVQIRYLFNPSINYDVPNDWNFFSNGITITYDNTVVFDVLFNSPIQPFEFSSWGSGGSGSMIVCGGFLPSDHVSGSVQRFYPFALSEPLYDSNGDLIFGWIENPTINTGSAVQPDHFDKQQIHHQGHSRPGHVPVPPTFDTYTWSNYTRVTIDTSSLEKLVESIFNLIEYNATWFGSNLGGMVNNAIGNVKKGFDYIGETIDYHLGLIIDNIQDFMDNFYDNMSSLFQPFFANFEGAFKMLAFIYVNGLDNNGDWSLGTFFHFLFIPDPDDLSDLLVSHDLYDVIGLAETTQTNMNTIKSMITGGNNLYKITIPQFSIMGVQLGAYDIDFSWYLSYKSVGDPIISAFLIFGYFLWLHARLPYWLRGQQGDIVGFAKEVQK